MKNLTPESRVYLPKIIEELDNIVSFTSGLTLEIFLKDKKTQYAVEHSIAIISEASGHIRRNDPEAEMKFNEFPFKNFNSLRNLSLHKYWKVDPEIIWNTATNEIAALQREIRNIFSEDIGLLKNVDHDSILSKISHIHTTELKTGDITKAIQEVVGKKDINNNEPEP